MLRLNQVKVRAGQEPADLNRCAAEILRVAPRDILGVKIVRRSIDARKKPDIFYSYTLDVEVREQERVLRRFRGKENLVGRPQTVTYTFPKPGETPQDQPVVIVGMGPAGLFCGYYLALHGYAVTLLERGKCVEERQKDVERFWETGRLDTASNVQFGEGGAGTFSDGKLNTLVKDRDGRNKEVLQTFVRFGADESICYDAKPHIGTDVLGGIVSRMRQEIIRLGGIVRFSACVTGLRVENGRVTGVVLGENETIPCRQVVLACGHSARDTFSMLFEEHVNMEAKAFAVGLRVEHLQAMINLSQYGKEDPGVLGAAPYKVTARTGGGRGVYSFCMCPGGYVVNASSEEGRLAVNGMSCSGRDGTNANSAVIVTVTPADFGSDHPLAGIEFQRRLEEKAYELGGGRIPVQRYGEFKAKVAGDRAWEVRQENPKDGEGLPMPQCRGGFAWADVSRILPKSCNEAIVEGMESFGRQIDGFDRPDTLLSGVESRTSSPVRICRDDTLQANVRGLYPCGEGAGYAGGIVSAAMDGIRVAEAIASKLRPAKNGKEETDTGN